MATRHGSMKHQVTETLRPMFQAGKGTSKHADKIANSGKPEMGKIYSSSTYHNYINAATDFGKWAKAEHGCKTLGEAEKYTGDYLRSRMEGDKSAWTVRRDAAALGKLYQKPTTELGADLPRRERHNITQHREAREQAPKGYSEAKNQNLADLCRSTGLRRSEIENLRPEQVRTRDDGSTVIDVRGKGGREREVPCLDGTAKRLAEQAAAEGRERVIDHFPNRAPIHAYRAEYAQALYEKLARDTAQLAQEELYKCRGDSTSIYDREAMREASEALGHSRLDVMTHYLK